MDNNDRGMKEYHGSEHGDNKDQDREEKNKEGIV